MKMQLNDGVLVQDKGKESERPLATLCSALLCSTAWELPDFRGRQEVYHRLIILFYGKQL
jgi:hypothetical protein